jgi:hypothetical protein
MNSHPETAISFRGLIALGYFGQLRKQWSWFVIGNGSRQNLGRCTMGLLSDLAMSFITTIDNSVIAHPTRHVSLDWRKPQGLFAYSLGINPTPPHPHPTTPFTHRPHLSCYRGWKNGKVLEGEPMECRGVLHYRDPFDRVGNRLELDTDLWYWYNCTSEIKNRLPEIGFR